MEGRHAGRWITSFFAVVLTVVLLLAGIAYLIDPFFQFRVKDNAYMLVGRFVSGGLIRNYDYDTLIIGSSMTQNFDMDVFRSELGVKPLHIGLGGISADETKRLVKAANDADKVKHYYICIDLSSFTSNAGENQCPEYLFRQDLLSRLRYLLSYEVWFRYVPVDTCFMALDRLGVSLPLKFSYSKSIDRLEDWRLDFPASKVGEKAVLDNYLNSRYSVSAVDIEDLYERMAINIDRFLAGFDFENAEYAFFFPPYSSLFWCEAQREGYFEAYLEAKRHFLEMTALKGVDTYDFQCAEITTDLENYKDTTHYLPEINDWMVKCFANGDYLVTQENIRQYQDRLMNNTDSFWNRYAYLFA